MIKKLLDKLEAALKEGDVKGAKKLADKIYKRPQQAEVYFDIAKLYTEAKLFDDAIPHLKKAFSEKTELAQQFTVWLDQVPLKGAHKPALQMVELADQARPNDILIVSARGVVLNRLERFDESIPLFEGVLGYAEQTGDNSRTVHALSGLGEAYFKSNRYHDAIGVNTLALEMAPNSIDGHYQIGLSHIAIGNITEGVKFLSKVIEMNPEHLGAHINLAHVMLKLGMFDQGWQHHEWRFHESMENIAKFNLPCPRWSGEPLEGKDILIWVDQGLGDQVMYCSVINRLIDLGASVTVMAERRLKVIFERSFNIRRFYPFDRPGIQELSQSGDTYHFHMAMGTLPAFFIRSFDDFGDGAAFLKVDEEKSAAYSKELRERFPGKKLVGFGWRGGIAATRNHARFIDLELWQPVFDLDNIQFINFQYDVTPQERELLDAKGVYTPDIDLRLDIDNTLSYMNALDLYLTADNTNAHLAGAIGLPVWNLIPFSAEWRWFMDRDDSPWYSSMRLFRNPELDTWAACMGKVELALAKEFGG